MSNFWKVSHATRQNYGLIIKLLYVEENMNINQGNKFNYFTELGRRLARKLEVTPFNVLIQLIQKLN